MLVALAVAAILGFVAFVNLAGEDDPVSSTAGAGTVADAPVSVEPAFATPINITDLRLTGTVDAVTGEPGSTTNAFGIGEPVHLWLSFEAGEQSAALTAVWFRDDSKVARMTAPLPEAASQMVFPLPQVAVDRPGFYRVEVRSHGDVLVAESFEVTNG